MKHLRKHCKMSTVLGVAKSWWLHGDAAAFMQGLLFAFLILVMGAAEAPWRLE